MSLYQEDGRLKIFLRAGFVLCKFFTRVAYFVFESSKGPLGAFHHYV